MSILRTYTGVLFDLNEFKSDNIVVEDIAHALSNSCRYNGHCKKFYSIAEHSVRAMRLSMDKVSTPFVLLHDASEAYMGDVVTPLKQMMPWYKEKEHSLSSLIFDKYCTVPYTEYIEGEVHFADKLILDIEISELWGASSTKFGWSPERAKLEFLHQFSILENDGLLRR